MGETVHPDFVRFVERRAASARREDRIGPGDVLEPVDVDVESLQALASTAARIAAGLHRPTRRREVVWIEGDSELAVGIDGLEVRTSEGRLDLAIPVRCDQTGADRVQVTFAVGRPGAPAGLQLATQRRPVGPPVVVDTWGESLVAFAWQVVLTLAAQLARAAGKDRTGNLLVPVELVATERGLAVTPMGRHRFSGATGLVRR